MMVFQILQFIILNSFLALPILQIKLVCYKHNPSIPVLNIINNLDLEYMEQLAYQGDI